MIKNNLDNIIGNVFGDALKIIDRSDTLKDFFSDEDSVLSASIWGKIVQKLVEKGLVIEDLDKAYNAAISSTYLTTFLDAINNLSIELNNISWSSPESFSYKTFDINKLEKDDLVLFYKEQYDLLLQENDAVNKEKIPAINNYINNHLKLNLLVLFENDSLAYKAFIEYYKTEKYKAEKDLLLKDIYEEKLSLEFNEITLNDREGLTLSDLYIEPSFKIHEQSLNYRPRTTYEEFPNESIEDLITKVFHKCNSKNELNYLSEDDIDTIFIAGYPGQGKSSFCKSFFHNHIKNKVFEENIVFIKLRDISEPQRLLQDLEATIIKNIDYELDSLERHIVILDGLDELYMKSSLTLNEIDTICHKLIKVKFKVILTTRHQYINFELFHEKNCLLIALGELSQSQQIKWLKRYSSKHKNLSLTEEVLNTIHESKDKYRHILELISQPILLHMIASININIIGNDLTKTKLYEEFFNRLLDRSWENKQIDLLMFMSEDKYKLLFTNILQDIAIAIFYSKNEYINKEDMLSIASIKMFNQIISKENVGNETFSNSIKGLMVAFYFNEVKQVDGLILDDEYAIEFLHKSLMEFQVAEKIWRTIKMHENRFDLESSINMFRELFSKKILSKEIVLNLNEIIRLDTSSDSEEILEPYLSHMNNFLENDFLQANNSNQSISSSVNTFFGYWSLLKALAPTKSLINTKSEKKFIKFLRIALNYDLPVVDLSYQRFENTNFDNMNLANSNLTHATFRNISAEMTTFHGAICNETKFIDSKLNRSVFDYASLVHTSFEQSSLLETSFRSANTKDIYVAFANCNGANFSNTGLKGKDLYPASLENVLGLE